MIELGLNGKGWMGGTKKKVVTAPQCGKSTIVGMFYKSIFLGLEKIYYYIFYLQR
jgi:hypothetical protein